MDKVSSSRRTKTMLFTCSRRRVTGLWSTLIPAQKVKRLLFVRNGLLPGKNTSPCGKWGYLGNSLVCAQKFEIMYEISRSGVNKLAIHK